MGAKTINCQNCSAPLELIEGQDRAVCPYCGSTTVIELSAAEAAKKSFEFRQAHKDELNSLEEKYNAALVRGDHDEFLKLYRRYLYLSMKGTPGYEDEEFLNKYVDEQVERYQRSFDRTSEMTSKATRDAQQRAQEIEKQARTAVATGDAEVNDGEPGPARKSRSTARRSLGWRGILGWIGALVVLLFSGASYIGYRRYSSGGYLSLEDLLDPGSVGITGVITIFIIGTVIWQFVRRRF